jgi:outer membrane lipoprotein-sorting protein
MSNDKPGFDHAPELEPELDAAVWSVIQEPLDADAVSRVKARAKGLAEQERSTSVTASEPTVRKANRTRALSMTRIVQALAASIAVAVGGWLWFSSSNSAFAQVIEQLRAAKTLTYLVEMDHEHFDEPIQQRVMVAADGRTRHEAGPLVSIFDLSGNLRLHLNKLTKHAYTMNSVESNDFELSESELDEIINSLESSDFEFSDSELDEMKNSWESLGVAWSESEFDEVMKQLESRDFKFSETEIAEIKNEIKNSLESTDFDVSDLDWIEWLRDHTGKPDRKLGRRMVEGRELDGFVVLLEGDKYTIWLDPVTNSLARVEYDASVGGSQLGKTVMKDFRFDVPLDEALFSYDPPPGYSIKDVANVLPETGVPLVNEETLVEALRGFTKLSGGKFPKSLSNWSDWLDVLEDSESEEAKMLTARLGVIFIFLSDMAKEDYEYLGAGKSVDDDRSIVFWHRTEDGALRAVYSDLSVSEIDESELP